MLYTNTDIIDQSLAKKVNKSYTAFEGMEWLPCNA